jgi:hypothetical protein
MMNVCFIKCGEKLIDKYLNLCYITHLELSHYYKTKGMLCVKHCVTSEMKIRNVVITFKTIYMEVCRWILIQFYTSLTLMVYLPEIQV